MPQPTSYTTCGYWNDGYAEGDADCYGAIEDLYRPRVNKDAFWRAVRAREMRDKDYRN